MQKTIQKIVKKIAYVKNIKKNICLKKKNIIFKLL